MKIVFTLCSINYLPQAATLCDSLRHTNPDWQRIVGLVDQNTEGFDLTFLDAELLEVDRVPIDGFVDMVESYSIVELITAVKPSYFLHLLQLYPEAEQIIYFDPDIMVFSELTALEETLSRADIVLTPHFTTPISDALRPTEKHVFRTGVFNLGFLAISRSANAVAMLEWWRDRLRYDCVIDLSHNLFFDQIWINLAPAYFEGVFIEKSPAYNVAHWNLHERTISKQEDAHFVNGERLVFFHFSHFSLSRPNEIAAYHTRFTFETRPDLKALYDEYTAGMRRNNYGLLKSVRCFYMKNERAKLRKRAFNNFIKNAVPVKLKLIISKWMGR